MDHKNDTQKDTTHSAAESRGVLSSVWSAAGALAETVTHAVQETVDRIQHEPITSVSGYVAHKVVDTAHSLYNKTAQVVEDVVESAEQVLGKVTETVSAPTTIESDKAYDTFLSSPTSDFMEATKDEIKSEIIKKNLETASEVATDNTKSEGIIESENQFQNLQNLTGEFKLELTMDVVAHLQRIADRTGDAVLHDTARKAHSACAKGTTEGVNLVRVTPEQATELVNLAIRTQDHGLADFARYCQSVAATSQIGIEPTPGKIQEELAKGRQELSQQGRVHTGPGYGAAFASASRAAPTQSPTPAVSEPVVEQAPVPTQSGLQLNMEMVAHLQRIADRTGDQVLHETARKAHSVCAKGASEAPGVHLVSISPDQAGELVNLAIRTQDSGLANFARYCQSVAATNQVGIEPSPGKIASEIEKGRQELAQQGRSHTGPGYGAAFASISRSNSQQNLLSRSNSQQNLNRSDSQQNLNRSESQQNLKRWDSQQNLERSESQQNIKRWDSQQNLKRWDSQQNLAQSDSFYLKRSDSQQTLTRSDSRDWRNRDLSRSVSAQNVFVPASHQQNAPTNSFLNRSTSMQSLNVNRTSSRSTSPANVPLGNLQLTMDVVAHLQRIADRTGDTLLHDTARKAHSACSKNLNDAPGVHLTWVTPDHATELVNLAIRTQDPELADFARYCQSVAATSQIAIEPTPGKVFENIEKGRLELQQQGRAHTGPGYGAAFASKTTQKLNEQGQMVEEVTPAAPSVV